MLNIQQVSSTVIINNNQSVFVPKEHTELTPVTFLTFLALQSLAFPIASPGQRREERSEVPRGGDPGRSSSTGTKRQWSFQRQDGLVEQTAKAPEVRTVMS